jgi:hypothetical protein
MLHHSPVSPSSVALAAVVVMLLCADCGAHALGITHYPLGPNPLGLSLYESPVYALVILSPWLAAFGLLYWRAPQVGFLGNLWRSAVLYVVARGIEFSLMFLPLDVPWNGWNGDPAERALQAAALLAASSVVTLGLMRLLYKNATWRARVALAFGTNFLGYTVALLISIGIYRIYLGYAY